MPATSELLMYSSMALVSGADREKSLLLGGDEPGRRSIAQSYGRCGGSDVTRTLLNTSFKSWYSDGTPERSGNSEEGMSSVFYWTGRHIMTSLPTVHLAALPLVLLSFRKSGQVA